MPAREPNFLREALSKPNEQEFVPLEDRAAHAECPMRNLAECLKIDIRERCDHCLLRAR